MPITIQPAELKYKNGNVFQSVDCLRGEKGDPGVPGPPGSPGDPTELIDDQSGAGDLDKTWSADKISGISEQIEAVGNAIAVKYENLQFPVEAGQVCWYEGQTYIAPNDIETAEEWNSSHWTRYYFDEDIMALRNGKADKSDTVLDTTLSRGRKANTSVGSASIAFGYNLTASGQYSEAKGSGTTASGSSSHAEGFGTTASGNNSHAEGYLSTASGRQSHAEGLSTEATGSGSHAEGEYTIAAGDGQHVAGRYNKADSYDDWPEWVADTHYEVGDKVKRLAGAGTKLYGYICKTANTDSTFISAKWTSRDERMNYAEIIGNGTKESDRSNARTLDWDGNEELAGDLTINKGTANETSVGALKNAINDKLDAPATAGTNGQVLTSDGQGGQSWQTPSGGGGDVTDVQINGTSILNQGVANIPLGSNETFGALKGRADRGTTIVNGWIQINAAGDSEIKLGNSSYRPAGTDKQHQSVFYGLAKASGDTTQSASSNAVGTYTETAKSAISDMLSAPETISGTTPTITAKPGIRYICGEVATLDVTAPESGCIDVVFTSGSTPTVLTVTSAKSNTTVKWVGDFDPTSLEANTQYEINVMDGEWGMAVSWT